MSKKILVLALVAVSIAAYISVASAHQEGKGTQAIGTIHEEMNEVMETGTYNDLIALREKYSRNFMPWVDSQEDFEIAQEMHERMEEFHEESGFGMMGQRGMMKGHGMGLGREGCPMNTGA